MEGEAVGVVAGEAADARERGLGGVVEVVEGGDVAAGEEQLEHRVGANVAGAARDQNGFGHLGLVVSSLRFSSLLFSSRLGLSWQQARRGDENERGSDFLDRVQGRLRMM